MKWALPAFPFPLLAKELAELAARRRTYLVRAGYAGVLFGAFLLVTNHYFDSSHSGLGSLGSGEHMLDTVMKMQFAGILLFLPTMMAGALAHEKERNSLTLLLLTDLRPGAILMEKYLGHLMPALNFILLSLPLFGLCYAFGGVTAVHLVVGIAALVLTCLELGALALFCSAFCRTTGSAMVSSYVLAGVLGLGLPLFVSWSLGLPDAADPVLFSHVAAYAYLGAQPGGLLVQSVAPLLVSLAFLVLARAVFVRRALAPPNSAAVGFFRRLERAIERANKAAGNIRLRRESSKVPYDHPVAWLELAKKLLGQRAFLYFITTLLEAPVLVMALGTLSGEAGWPEALSTLLVIYWILAALSIAVLTASAVGSERAKQTIELLLTTTLPSREIVEDKLAGVRRLIFVFWIPLLTGFAARACSGVSRWTGDVLGVRWGYLVFSVMAMVLFLPWVAWLSAFIALKARTRIGAILSILVALTVWNALPLFLLIMLAPHAYSSEAGTWGNLFWLTPGTTVVHLEFSDDVLGGYYGGGQWLCLCPLVYWHLTRMLRAWCLKKADRYLGRWPRRPARHDAPAAHARG